MLIDLVSRTKVIHVTRERPSGHTTVGARSIASEAELVIENLRAGEVTSIKRLLPVSWTLSAHCLGGIRHECRGKSLRLGTSVAADSLELVLVRPHEVTVERKEGADEVSNLRNIDVDTLQLIKDCHRTPKI